MKESTGERSLDYSAWHRQLERFVPREFSITVSMCDIDGYEYCQHPECLLPVAFIETTTKPHHLKFTKPLEVLSRTTGIPAFLVRVIPSPTRVLITKLAGGKEMRTRDLDLFELDTIPSTGIKTLTPSEYAKCLMMMHVACKCGWLAKSKAMQRYACNT